MTKFLLILLVIFALAILGLTFIYKKIRGFFEMFSPSEERRGKTQKRERTDDVVYDRDDVVVLKGEAGKKKKERSE
ncbi:MAG: hypothetical protein ACLFQX_07240 [Candidatus Kapaibacterium sp.]